MAPSRCDWKIVDWDVKPQHNQPTNGCLYCYVPSMVEGDFQFCWVISPNVGQTHKENPNLVRIIYMAFILNDIYKQYNKLHKQWYTKISSLRSAEDRNPPQNASDLYTKYRSYAEHCRPCTRLSDEKKKKNLKTVSIGYSLFEDHRSVPSFGPGFFCLNSGLSKVNSVWVCTCIFDNAVTGDIPLISLVLKSMVPP